MTTILPFYNNLAGHGDGDSDYGLTPEQKEEVIETYNDILHAGVNSPIRAMEMAVEMADNEIMRQNLIEDAIKDKRWLDKASGRLWHPYEVERFSGRFGDLIIISRLAKFGPLTLGPIFSAEARDVDFWTDTENRHAFAGDGEHDRWVLLETQGVGVLDDSFNEKWRLVANSMGVEFIDETA